MSKKVNSTAAPLEYPSYKNSSFIHIQDVDFKSLDYLETSLMFPDHMASFFDNTHKIEETYQDWTLEISTLILQALLC